MKLDLDLIKELLKKEEARDSLDRVNIGRNDFPEGDPGLKLYEKTAYHYGLLFDAGFLDGKVIYCDTLVQREVAGVVCYKLTFEGHSVLEAMNSDTLWNSLKDKVVAAGIEGLRCIPSLAIELLLNS